MELLCKDCRAVIQVADERIPVNTTFRLICPRCKSKIIVNANSPERSTLHKTLENSLVVGGDMASLTTAIASEDVNEKTASVHSSQASALLYWSFDEDYSFVREALQRMGYVVDVQVAADQAIDRLRTNQYQIVVFSSHAVEQSRNPVEDYLASLNMSIRREIFVVMVGGHLKTADHLQSFIHSVNLVVHVDDLSNMELLVAQGLRDHARFYKVFLESLVEAGKRR